MNLDNKSLDGALTTGFKDLDNTLGGIRKGELVIIGGRPSIGKTSLAISIAKHVAQNEKVPTVFFSFEMSREQILSNYLGMNSDVDNLIIDDRYDYTIFEFISECKHLKKEKDIGLVVIDYLQLFPNTIASKNRDKELAETVNELKTLVNELNLSIVITSQIYRGYIYYPNQLPLSRYLRGYEGFEQSVDKVIIIYRNDYYRYELGYTSNLEKSCIGEILVLKNQNGETGAVKLWWDESTGWSDHDGIPGCATPAED